VGGANPLDATAVDLWVDGVVVMDTREAINREAIDVSLAIACLVASYFVYGIEYPKQLKNTLLFMQKFIFSIDEKSKIPPTVLRVFNMLV